MNSQVYCPNCFSINSIQNNVCKACGYTIQQPSDEKTLAVGEDLHGRYIVGRVLGIGGFGITYLCMNRINSRICAVKEYFPNEWVERSGGVKTISPSSPKYKKNYQHGLEVFLNEARILRGLRTNKFVVNVTDFFRENQTAYLVMEYIAGETLAQHIMRKKEPLSYEEANTIVLNIAHALSEIHQMGLLHRDISPDNIMICKDGKVKLIDFGATRQYVANETVNMSVLIKPGFAPLEQYSRTGNQGPWTDVYALAATYYYIVSGKKPLTATERCAGVEMKSLHERQRNIPTSISNVIQMSLEMDYKRRPENMKKFLERFQSALSAHADLQESSAHLYMVRNNKIIRKWRFHAGRRILIGRSQSECDICVEDALISRMHCEIRYEVREKVFYLTDFSANGTFSNSGLIGKNRYQKLSTGDEFYLVSSEYKFKVEVN